MYSILPQIRQYFKDSAFYLGDLEARGLCANDTSSFVCQAFSPSAATVKVRAVYSMAFPSMVFLDQVLSRFLLLAPIASYW